MGDLAEIFKTLGIVSSSFIVVAGIAITLLRYVLKANEQKNNIIANHIQHTADILEDVKEMVKQNTIVLISIKETIQEILHERRRD